MMDYDEIKKQLEKWEREQYQAYCKAQEDAKALQRARVAEHLLLSLTPGGSEFVDDPGHCSHWIRERLNGTVEQVKRRKDAEQRVEQLERLLRLTIETIDDDAPGPGTTEKDLLRQIRAAISVGNEEA